MSRHDKLTNRHNSDCEIDFLRDMLIIREMEQRAVDLSHTKPPTVPGSLHLCAGQEAVPVGVVSALEPDDQIVATYRGHGWALASGLSLLEVFGEICHRDVGINGGRAGSAYMMAPDRRFIGENSIVGAGIPVACGVAMANVLEGNGGVVVVSVGDGAFNQGATHEGIAFAAARNLPLIVICENNGWSELTPTSVTFKVDRIAKRAAGYGIPGSTIDGTDLRAITETIKAAADHARKGGGPSIIECRVPRLWGHYNNDVEHYRPKEDRADAESRDPIALLTDRLISESRISRQEADDLRQQVKGELDATVAEVLAAAEADPETALANIYANVKSPAPVSTGTHAEAETRQMTYVQAVNEALRRELEANPRVIVYGEDIGHAGGIFGQARHLQKTFGSERVFDTPISESAILGSAVGAAMKGFKPIVEIMFADFLLVALDQIINQAANIRYVTNGKAGAPMVVRTQQGMVPGSCAQHSQCLEALLAHIPGVRVGVPSTPQDAYELLRSAAASLDPCILFEARGLYAVKGDVCLSDDVPAPGKARLHRSGSDAIIVTWGTMLSPALQASDDLKQKGIDAGVLDLRWLNPLDEEALYSAARNASGNVIVAHEANGTGGFGAEISARLHENLGRELNIRTARVTAPDTRVPASPVLQKAIFPSTEAIVNAVLKLAG